MKYLIVTEDTLYNGMFKVMFSDVLKLHNVEILSNYLNETNQFRRLIISLLYKNKINKHLKGSFEPILKPKLHLEDFLKKNKHEKKVIIFLNSSLQKIYSSQNLKRLKKQYINTYFVLLFVDSISQLTARRATEIMKDDVFDLIYSFNERDAIKYNLYYYLTPYSKLDFLENKQNDVDAYFCGSDKGRRRLLDNMAVIFQKLNISYKFDVYSRTKVDEKLHYQLKYDDYKDYRDIVKETSKCKCIIDIVQNINNGDVGLSLRVHEALVYNKILITNNKNILKYPFYNSKYMHLIENENDIKKDWFEIDDVDYGYKNQLSPLLFFENIERKLKKLNEG